MLNYQNFKACLPRNASGGIVSVYYTAICILSRMMLVTTAVLYFFLDYFARVLRKWWVLRKNSYAE